MFFDKQFKFVEDGSGVKQVDSEPGQLETLSSGRIVARKNGYVYVYMSNESAQVSLSRKGNCSGCSLPAETIVQAGLIIWEGAGKYDSRVVEKIPAGQGARQKALNSEASNANKLRSRGQLKDKKYHQRP